MKKFFILMAALFGSLTASHAIVDNIATLQHEGNLSYFYGQGALNTAYEAAVDGDIITLSAGTFTFSDEFTKGITLRGTGIEATEKTYINSRIYFYSENSTSTTTIEGIIFSEGCHVYNNFYENGQGTLNFIKNKFSYVSIEDYEIADDQEGGLLVRLYNNFINSFSIYSSDPSLRLSVYNCYMADIPYNSSYSEEKAYMYNFSNCVIRYSYSYTSNMRGLKFTNCIFYNYSSFGNSFPYGVLCNNCVSVNNSSLFNDITESGVNNNTVNALSDIFKTYDGSANVAAGETFELTDEAKAAYLGIDDTEVGMQGGMYPYTPTVGYPVITKLDAAAKTSKDGRLTIEIEVDGK